MLKKKKIDLFFYMMWSQIGSVSRDSSNILIKQLEELMDIIKEIWIHLLFIPIKAAWWHMKPKMFHKLPGSSIYVASNTACTLEPADLHFRAQQTWMGIKGIDQLPLLDFPHFNRPDGSNHDSERKISLRELSLKTSLKMYSLFNSCFSSRSLLQGPFGLNELWVRQRAAFASCERACKLCEAARGGKSWHLVASVLVGL